MLQCNMQVNNLLIFQINIVTLFTRFNAYVDGTNYLFGKCALFDFPN